MTVPEVEMLLDEAGVELGLAERPYDVRGGIPCQCTTYNYDLNGNVIEMVDSDDSDLSDANDSDIAGIGDRLRRLG